MQVYEVEKRAAVYAVEQAFAVVHAVVVDFLAVLVQQLDAHFVLQGNLVRLVLEAVLLIVLHEVQRHLCRVSDLHGFVEPLQKDDLEQPHQQKDNAHKQHKEQPDFRAQP